MSEPKTIREYIEQRRVTLNRIGYAPESVAYAELNGIERWLDAHEPKAVGAETKLDIVAALAETHRHIEALYARAGQGTTVHTSLVAAQERAKAFTDVILAEQKKDQP